MVTTVINCVNHLPTGITLQYHKKQWSVKGFHVGYPEGLITTTVCYWTEGTVDMKKHGKTFESLYNSMFHIYFLHMSSHSGENAL